MYAARTYFLWFVIVFYCVLSFFSFFSRFVLFLLFSVFLSFFFVFIVFFIFFYCFFYRFLSFFYRFFIVFFVQDLKTIVFGSSVSSFNSEWRNQGFTFCHLTHLKYGIVQHKVRTGILVVSYT